MTENECLEAIASGDTAETLLLTAMPNAERRWRQLCKQMRKYLEDVQRHFPDAEYYTGGGSFNLMLGASHAEDRNFTTQDQLVALSGAEHRIRISDGDF